MDGLVSTGEKRMNVLPNRAPASTMAESYGKAISGLRDVERRERDVERRERDVERRERELKGRSQAPRQPLKRKFSESEYIVAKGDPPPAKHPRLNDDGTFDGEEDDTLGDGEDDETFVPDDDTETCVDDDDDEHSDEFREHITKHSGGMPYKCGMCGLLCNKKSNLKVHLMVHSGERPYKCGVCDKPFSRTFNLRRHMRTHRPHKCKRRPKLFSRKDKLEPSVASALAMKTDLGSSSHGATESRRRSSSSSSGASEFRPSSSDSEGELQSSTRGRRTLKVNVLRTSTEIVDSLD